MSRIRGMRLLGLAVATTLGTGLCPIAPGTVGSLVSLLAFLVLFGGSGGSPSVSPWMILVPLVPIALAGCSAGKLQWGKDPGRVNVDEVAGAWLALCMVPAEQGIPGLLLATGLFRLLDILKPWPLILLDRMDSAAGVLLDDLGAGLTSGAALVLLGELGLVIG